MIKRLWLVVSVLWAIFWLLVLPSLRIIELEGSLVLFAALPFLSGLALFYVARYVIYGRDRY